MLKTMAHIRKTAVPETANPWIILYDEKARKEINSHLLRPVLKAVDGISLLPGSRVRLGGEPVTCCRRG